MIADTLVSTTRARLRRDWLCTNGFDVEPASLMRAPPFLYDESSIRRHRQTVCVSWRTLGRPDVTSGHQRGRGGRCFGECGDCRRRTNRSEAANSPCEQLLLVGIGPDGVCSAPVCE